MREGNMKLVDEAEKQRLIDEYGAPGVESGTRLQRGFFIENMAMLADMDADFTQAWVDWIYAYMYNRKVLDERTRILVIIGECVALREERNLANHIRSAIRAGAKPEEVLEVILHTCIYVGMPTMFKALRIFRQVQEEDGLQLPASNKKRHTDLWPPAQYQKA